MITHSSPSAENLGLGRNINHYEEQRMPGRTATTSTSVIRYVVRTTWGLKGRVDSPKTGPISLTVFRSQFCRKITKLAGDPTKWRKHRNHDSGSERAGQRTARGLRPVHREQRRPCRQRRPEESHLARPRLSQVARSPPHD